MSQGTQRDRGCAPLISCSTRCLKGWPVVTSCSHIFCIPCATSLFSTNRQTCPACEAPVTEDDDVVQTSLNPTSAFKTTALAGMSPALVVDIASRALNFWQYQQGQEATYQSLVLKHSQEKVVNLEKQCRTIIQEANDEITILRDKLTASERDLETERRKVRELAEQQKENQRDYQKLKTQYDKAKQRAMLAPLPNGGAQPGGSNGAAQGAAPASSRHHNNGHNSVSALFYESNQQPHRPAAAVPPTNQRPMPFRQTPQVTTANFGSTARGGGRANAPQPSASRGFRPATYNG